MKPGRKLVELGSAACTDAEILAILIGSGAGRLSAMGIATDLLDRCGTLTGLMRKPLDELARIRGIKGRRAIRLAAAFELARRVVQRLGRDG